ncbi:MAG: hypothetical protein K9I36_06920 [Bacteroidia bacterium]|nr:hypothetical protein [Bacteroidia bacterium]MCF8426445.1 hypothetical protein [Bacteroidia bacterium]
MKRELLFPPHFKTIGWIVLLACIPSILFMKYIGMYRQDAINLSSMLAIIGFMMTVFSSKKNEDERTKLLRWKSLGKSFTLIILLVFIHQVFDLFNFTSDLMLSAGPMGLIYFGAINFYFSFWLVDNVS